MSTERDEIPAVDIVKEREGLTIEKTAIAARLAELGITYNRYAHKSHTIPDDQLAERKALAKRYAVIEKRLAEIKAINRIKGDGHTEYDMVKDILVETFGRDFKMAVVREMVRRKKGESPIKINAQNKIVVSAKSYKQELNHVIEMLIKARYAIDLYIQENEPPINKADYLIKVSKINKSLPSLSEIKKLKPL